MFSKSKMFFIISFWLALIHPLIAQQFTLEATIEKSISKIFDMDGDGICEYIADTNKVYDGSTHLLKYTIPSGYVEWNDPAKAQNPYSYFPHIDFNSDGKRELIMTTSTPSEALLIFDVSNNNVLFEFNPFEDYLSFLDLIDIDGDGELEILISTRSGSWPNEVYKTFIYSTGVTVTSLSNSDNNYPKNFKLSQNYPNPFNPNTTIRYSINSPDEVSIRIYDVSGQLIKEIIENRNQSGEYQVIWDGKNNFGESVSSGTYFYQLVIDNHSEAKKMILLK